MDNTSKANPSEMTICRPGTEVHRSPDNVASAPFWVEMLLDSAQDGETTAMRTVLDPGVISNWHTHPLGQILYVLSGVGRTQREGGPIEEIRAGDCVWFASNERHWHGASVNSPFSYLSTQGGENGRFVAWMEPVETIMDERT
jgi:quercetin dioxygenase-like cupin family protein